MVKLYFKSSWNSAHVKIYLLIFVFVNLFFFFETFKVSSCAIKLRSGGWWMLNDNQFCDNGCEVENHVMPFSTLSHCNTIVNRMAHFPRAIFRCRIYQLLFQIELSLAHTHIYHKLVTWCQWHFNTKEKLEDGRQATNLLSFYFCLSTSGPTV